MVIDWLAHWWKLLHCGITTRVSVATFLEKSQVLHSLAFNATDSLFNSPVCEVVCCFFRSLLALGVNGYYGRTNKEKTDGYRQWNLGSPKTHLQLLIVATGERNEDLRDYNFQWLVDYQNSCQLVFCPSINRLIVAVLYQCWFSGFYRESVWEEVSQS